MTREELQALTVTPPDAAVRAGVKAVWDGIAKPLDGLGAFEELTADIGAISGSTRINIQKRAILVMCADNGIVAEGVSQSGQEVTAIVASFMGKQQSSVGKMARTAHTDVIPVDVGINADTPAGVRNCKIMRGTHNFLREPAMSEEQALAALNVGISLVKECKENGYRLLGTGEMGIGNTTTSSTLIAALTGCPPEAIIGRGAGLDDAGLARKRDVAAQALARYPSDDPFPLLCAVGGLDIAALAGVCIGGALCRIPIVLDGVISMAAALAAERLVPGVRAFLLASHKSREPGARLAENELALHPVIDAGLGLGEGTGAVMLFSLLDLALALYEQQTTFSNMQLAPYSRYEAEPC